MTSDKSAPARPGTVNAAYILWIVAAVLLVLVSLLVLTVPMDQLRSSLAGEGNDAAQIDSYLGTIRVTGVVCAVLGVALGFLAGPVRAGHRRVRRILVVLSVVTVLLLLFAVFALGLFQELLVVALILATACALIYRPSAREWFVRGR